MSDCPLTHAESVAVLARLQSAGPVRPKPMPRVKRLAPGRADQIRAFAMVTAEMEASIARCEALEAAIAEPQA